MTVLLRNDDVAKIATVDVAIEAMTAAFRLEGEGSTGAPQRFDIANEHGWLRVMPVVVSGLGVFGFKAMNLTHGVGIRYVILIYDLAGGALRGIIDAQIVTAMRTAATSAVATRELAPPDVRCIAVIGTGAEARAHLEAMHAVRPAAGITVYSRSAQNRAAFVEDMSTRVGAEITDCSSLDEAVADASLVVLATKSPEPVLYARHLRPGMHVNSIGSARRDQFELALDTFPRFSTIVCDSKTHVFAEAGDAVAAVQQGVCGADDATNLGELVAGRGRGRNGPEELTLYKSVGTATQDIVFASYLLDLAEAAGSGQDIGDFPYLKFFG